MFKANETIDIKVFAKEAKKRERITKIQRKWDDAMRWVSNNKEELAIVIPVVAGGLAAGAKVVRKHTQLKKESDLKNLYCYDRSGGHYWKLRRELSTDEWIAIDKRKQNGERLSDILSDLKVLK